MNTILNLTKLELKTFTEQDAVDYCLLNNINPNDIKILDLAYNELTDISGIKLFKNLEQFHCPYNKITDISVLKDLTKLEYLNLYTNKITDISYIKKLKKLTTLVLGYNNIKKLSNIKYLKKLKNITIGCNELTDISELKYLNKLETLFINNNPLKDLSDIKNLKIDTLNINELELEQNQVQYINPSIVKLFCKNTFKDKSEILKINKNIQIFL